MTTINEAIVKIYEPTAKDRIQRILYRLDNGEQLNDGRLCRGDKFCILGLFADESGQVFWEHELLERSGVAFFSEGMYYRVNDQIYLSRLDPSLVEYYNLKDELGSFDIAEIPEEYREIVGNIICGSLSCLLFLNDNAIRHGFTTEYVNELLASVIRSGAVFKKE